MVLEVKVVVDDRTSRDSSVIKVVWDISSRFRGFISSSFNTEITPLYSPLQTFKKMFTWDILFLIKTNNIFFHI